MKSIIFIAPPAAGKGTQSKLLSEEYNIPHISTGDLLRDEIKEETELGKQIKDIMDQGQLVNDNIMANLLEKRLSKKDCQEGYILDGYPRNIDQAKVYEQILDKLNKTLGPVIFLDIDKDLALERTLSRIICPSCGSSYNLLIEELKPKKDGICDKCCQELKIRTDDTKETFLNRYETYREKTKSLIEYYQNKKVLETIKVEKDLSAEEIFSKIKEIINN